MVSALASVTTTVVELPETQEFTFPAESRAPIDFVFLSTELGEESIAYITKRAYEHNPHVRLILIDPQGTYRGDPSIVGAHSLVHLTPQTAEIAAKYWANCLYPPN